MMKRLVDPDFAAEMLRVGQRDAAPREEEHAERPNQGLALSRGRRTIPLVYV